MQPVPVPPKIYRFNVDDIKSFTTAAEAKMHAAKKPYRGTIDLAKIVSDILRRLKEGTTFTQLTESTNLNRVNVSRQMHKMNAAKKPYSGMIDLAKIISDILRRLHWWGNSSVSTSHAGAARMRSLFFRLVLSMKLNK